MSYSFTREACHQRRALSPEDRNAVDKLVMGVRIAPSIGVVDPATGAATVQYGEGFRIVYRVVDEQVVILHIGPPRHRMLGPRIVHSGALV